MPTPSDPHLEVESTPGGLPPGVAEAFRVQLPSFEGPLDLLLHLIREHRIDVFDIPIALITEKYNQSLARMAALDLDVAGEFLVMAATLAHIKSRLLLPRTEPVADGGEAGDDQLDPRVELVRRLLAYQKYREAARELGERSILNRDVFARRISMADAADRAQAPLAEVPVYRLIEALDRVLRALEPRVGHEVVRDQLSLAAAMQGISARLTSGDPVTFLQLFQGQRTRGAVVVTFLALLEMVRLRLVRVHQPEGAQEIWVSAPPAPAEGPTPEVEHT